MSRNCVIIFSVTIKPFMLLSNLTFPEIMSSPQVILTRRRAQALVVMFWILSLIIALLPFATAHT